MERGASGNHVIRVCEETENKLNTLIGGEYVQRLFSPHYTLYV